MIKKILRLSVLFAFSALVISCGKEPVQEPENSGNEGQEQKEDPKPKPEVNPDLYEDIDFLASFEQYKGGSSVSCDSDERVLMWDKEGIQGVYAPFTAGSEVTMFKFSSPSGFMPKRAAFAFGPKDYVTSFTGKEVNFTIPAQQAYFAPGTVPASINPVVGVPSGNKLSLKNVCCLASLSVTGEGKVDGIRLTEKDGKPLSGDFTLAVSAAGTDAQVLNSRGSASIEIVCSKGIELSDTPETFTFVIPAVDSPAGAFQAEFMFSDGSSMTRDVTMTPVRRGQELSASVTLAPLAISANLENSVVKEYMDYVYAHPYTRTNPLTTYVSKYYLACETSRTDQPAPVSLSWSAGNGAQTLVISENADLSSPERTVSLSSGVSRYDIYNLIPGRKYFCRVSDSDGGALLDAVVTTAGRRRMLAIDGIGNVRDLGGIRTEDGTMQIRYGRIFRGCRMNADGIAITNDGIQEMKRLGIGADLDLRNDTQAAEIRYSPLGSDVDYIRFVNSSDGYFAKVRDVDVNIREMQWLIDEMKKGTNVYFHCKTGADRTGTLAYLIEGLLGCCEPDCSIDFELTSFFYDFGVGKASLRMRYGNENANYNYNGMYKAIANNYSGDTLQEKFYNYFNKGIGKYGTATISKADLDWFISEMLEPAVQ